MKEKKSILKIVACILILSLSITVLQPLSVFAAENVSTSETILEKWTPSAEDMRLPDTTGDLTLEQLETAVLLEEDIPEYISQKDIEEKGHVNRLREQEPDENTIVFQNRDGTKTAYFFSSPVKYTDKDGKVKDKSTKLDGKNIPNKHSEEYGYSNQQNNIKTYFPKEISDEQGMLVEYEDISIELIPIEATEKKYVLQNGDKLSPKEYFEQTTTSKAKSINIVAGKEVKEIKFEKHEANKANGAKKQFIDDSTKRSKDAVQYSSVFGNKTELRYSSTFEGFKEDIILYENTGVNHFSFRLKTNGLSLVCTEDKQYYLADPLSGEYIVSIGELIIYDSNNKTYKNDEGAEYNHYYKVTTVKADNEYILTVVVDEEFLNSEDTVYPVYIDPTMSIMSGGDIEDATLYSKSSEKSSSGKVKIGYNSATYGTARGLYDFPVLDFNVDFIHMYGNQITSATLYLYALPYGGGSSYDSAKSLSMYEFNSSWTANTVKWSNTNPNNYSTRICTSSVTSGLTAFDISYVMNKFKTDPEYTSAFNGLLLKADDESYTTWKQFASSSYTTTSRRPYIQITYNDSPAACSQVVSGATYYLKNQNTDYLDVYDAGTTDNTELLTYAFNGNENQQFKITNVYGGEYEIAPQHTTGKILSVNSLGQVVIEEDCNLSRQRWYIFYRNGFYHIVNKLYNTGIMAPTHDTDYVSINNKYQYCCWELVDPQALKQSTIINFDYDYLIDFDNLVMFELNNGDAYAYLTTGDTKSGTVLVDNAVKSSLHTINEFVEQYPNAVINNNLYLAVHQGKMLADDITSKYSSVLPNSLEYYAIWLCGVQVLKQVHDYVVTVVTITAETVVFAFEVYELCSAAKAVGMTPNQKKTFSASENKSMAQTIENIDDITDSQAISYGITDGSATTSKQRTWQQSEVNEATYFPNNDGYTSQVSFKKDASGNIVPAYYGEAGSIRIDRYKPGHVVEVKNYNITSSTGRNNLINNIRNQYWQRKSFFGSDTKQTYVIDIYGQNVSESILLSLENSIYNATETSIQIIFRNN